MDHFEEIEIGFINMIPPLPIPIPGMATNPAYDKNLFSNTCLMSFDDCYKNVNKFPARGRYIDKKRCLMIFDDFYTMIIKEVTTSPAHALF